MESRDAYSPLFTRPPAKAMCLLPTPSPSRPRRAPLTNLRASGVCNPVAGLFNIVPSRELLPASLVSATSRSETEDERGEGERMGSRGPRFKS